MYEEQATCYHVTCICTSGYSTYGRGWRGEYYTRSHLKNQSCTQDGIRLVTVTCIELSCYYNTLVCQHGIDLLVAKKKG